LSISGNCLNHVVTSRDIEFMRRALFLAERGRGTTTPNPVVGAVVVSAEGVVVGQGAHRVAGGPHAEVFALDAAGAHARGGTLYCTLEPCCHTGRTGPCAERVTAAGIARVVAALEDPDPRVAGGGFTWLRSHGVVVDTDVERDAAERQNAPFLTWVRRHRPHVTLKVAVSADGFAGKTTAPVRLSGPAIDRVMHRERAAVDAIAVGSTTVLVDDPLLTSRLAYRDRPLIRVVYDRRGRVTPAARVFQTLGAGPVIMFVGERQEASANGEALKAAGATVIEVPEDGTFHASLALLAKRNVQALLVEGGPTLHRAMWAAGVVDRVQVIQTSMKLGGGVDAFIPPVGDGTVCQRAYGSDMLMEWDVHRTD
jgi:diaminohydroxyphosphoribosylaminopyrimidine deaminase/5-amino-6-(5-phosphoribosylamino)uracil reductase